MCNIDLVQTLWLVRHAPVNCSYVYGQMDVDADFSGAREFAYLAKELPSTGYWAASDLSRCTGTAKFILNEENQLFSLQLDSDLREQDFGQWQGRSYNQIEKDDPDIYREFWKTPAYNAPPGGESFVRMQKRVMASVVKHIEIGHKENVIIAHAGTIRAIVSHALDIKPERALSLCIDPLSLTRLTLYKSQKGINFQVDWVNRIA